MKKALKHGTRKCGGTFEVEYNDDNIPTLICDKCEYRIEDWVRWNETYSKYWQDEEKWASKKDHIVCLLGYFAHLYQEYYGTGFTFSLNEKGLFRGQEAHHIRRTYAMFNSNAELVKAYIKWVFDAKVKLRKRKITSLGFLATPGVVAEFKLALQRSMQIRRDTPLPDTMLSWINEHVPEVRQHATLADHGDLHLLLSHYKRGHFTELSPVVAFVDKLKEVHYVTEDLKIMNWSE